MGLDVVWKSCCFRWFSNDLHRYQAHRQVWESCYFRWVSNLVDLSQHPASVWESCYFCWSTSRGECLGLLFHKFRLRWFPCWMSQCLRRKFSERYSCSLICSVPVFPSWISAPTWCSFLLSVSISSDKRFNSGNPRNKALPKPLALASFQLHRVWTKDLLRQAPCSISSLFYILHTFCFVLSELICLFYFL